MNLGSILNSTNLKIKNKNTIENFRNSGKRKKDEDKL